MTGAVGVFVHEKAICESTAVGDGTRIWAFAHVLPGAVIGLSGQFAGTGVPGSATLDGRMFPNLGLLNGDDHAVLRFIGSVYASAFDGDTATLVAISGSPCPTCITSCIPITSAHFFCISRLNAHIAVGHHARLCIISSTITERPSLAAADFSRHRRAQGPCRTCGL